MVWDIVKIGLEDIQKTFDIQENLYEKYVEGEIKKNEFLIPLISKRDNDFDWTKETPLGGAGTTLNACVLYCLIRHYNLFMALETGVSGGYYSTFLLSALRKNSGILRSIELSDNLNEVAKLVPKELKESPMWHLVTGTDSLKFFKEKEHADDYNKIFHLYCHDSLHTMAHMLKELNEFKKCVNPEFFVFIDDEKSDNFWQKCLQSGAFKKKGYEVRCISGAESRLNGHLGGFIQYSKSE